METIYCILVKRSSCYVKIVIVGHLAEEVDEPNCIDRQSRHRPGVTNHLLYGNNSKNARPFLNKYIPNGLAFLNCRHKCWLLKSRPLHCHGRHCLHCRQWACRCPRREGCPTWWRESTTGSLSPQALKCFRYCHQSGSMIRVTGDFHII